jgi:CheY-like chemotaxis protein
MKLDMCACTYAQGGNFPIVKSSSKTILLIEDEESIREALQQALEIEGYSVLTAANGQEGLDILKKSFEPPCLILLDLMMPVMNGWQFVEARKSDSKSVDVPVVVVTAYPNKGNTINANALIPKPIDFERLIELIARYCP